MKICKKVFLIIIVLFLRFSNYAQNTLDSLSVSEIQHLVKLGQKEKAAQFLFNKLKALQTTTNNTNETSKEYEKYINYFQKLTKNPDLRKQYFDNLITLRSKAEQLDTLGLIKSYYYAANDASLLRKYNLESLNYIDTAVRYWEKFYTKPTDFYAQLLTQQGASLYNNGLTAESFSINEKALKVYEEIKKPDKSFLYSLSIQLAKSYSKYGFYKKAKYHLDKADKILAAEATIFSDSEKNANFIHGYQMYLLSTYCRFYRDTEDETKLLKNLSRIEKFVQGKELVSWAKYYYAEAYNYAGFYYLNIKKEYEKAYAMFFKSKEIAAKGVNPIYKDYYHLNMGRALVALNKVDKALQIFATLEKKRLPSSLKGIIYASKSYAYAKLNKNKLALISINNAIKTFSKTKEKINIISDTTLTKFNSTGELYDTKHYLKVAAILKNKNADTLYIAANNLYKIALKQFKSSYQKNIYSKTLEKLYNNIAHGIIETNKKRYGNLHNDKSFIEDFIYNKSKFLWHKFLTNRKLKSINIPTELTIKEENLRKRLLFYQQYKKGNLKDSVIDLKISETKERLELLSSKLKDDYVGFSLFDNSKFSLSDLQKSLNKNQVILNYTVLGDSLYVFKITKKNTAINNLGNYIEVEKKAEKFLGVINNIGVSLQDIFKKGEVLFNTLNLRELTQEEIIIIPDKILHYIPFEALSSDRNDYLIKNKKISYAIALPFLNFNASKKELMNYTSNLFSPTYTNNTNNQSKNLIAFRDKESKLPGASEEAKQIAKIINGDLHSGNKATKENFINKSKNSSVLHLAMHATINDDNPELSNLIFSSNKKDNRLYISELYGLKLNSNLVVLGACNTAIGKQKLGQGMISLNRAFMYAGVPTTISSLWNLPDESTKHIMVDFYQNLKSKKNTANALRIAKLNFLKNQKDQNYLHPIFWAGIVHHGKTTTINFDDNSTLYIILASIFMVIFFAFIYKKRAG